ASRVERLLHRRRHPKTKRVTDERTVKLFRRDTDDRVLNTIQVLRSTDDVWIELIAIFPGSITDHRHRMRVSARAFFGAKAAAENRSDAERVEIVSRDDSAGGPLRSIANAQRRSHDSVDDERFEQRCVLLEVEKGGIGESVVSFDAARCADERQHAVLMRHKRIKPDQNSFNPTEDRGIRADAKRQAENYQDRKPRRSQKHSRAEPHVQN